jgi:hypothetical protein
MLNGPLFVTKGISVSVEDAASTEVGTGVGSGL